MDTKKLHKKCIEMKINFIYCNDVLGLTTLTFCGNLQGKKVIKIIALQSK